MKLLAALVLCVPLCALGVGTGEAPCVHPTPLVVVDDPPPPPFECPLCGGNAELHYKRMATIAKTAANLLLAHLVVR